MPVKKHAKTDPELLRQINSAAAGNESIQAVFSLDLPLKKLLDPATVEEVTHQVLKRAEKKVGCKPRGVNVFKNLGTFTVSGNASLIRKILDDPNIASAVANKQPDVDVKLRHF